jgi:hypothetical protein
MRFGKANCTELRAVTHMSCVDTFNRRDEGYDHDNAEYDGKDNHDGSAGVSVCRLLRIVFHGCLPKGARNNVTWLSWFRLPGRQYQGGGQISWSASGENTDGFLHTGACVARSAGDSAGWHSARPQSVEFRANLQNAADILPALLARADEVIE